MSRRNSGGGWERVSAAADRTGASPGEVQLAVAGVSKHFGGVRAVEDVSIAVRQGEILSVIGPNGAGKTTLLNMISGFFHPGTGSITLEGRNITHAPPSRVAALGIARTFQNIALFSGMTVLDNVMLGRHVHMKAGVLASFVYWGWARREEIAHRARAEEVLEFLQLQDIRKQPTGALAYGLRKRVELARALALEPKILLLDEPMAGMNQEEKQDVARYILDANRLWGTTIILIEHDMAVVMDISDRVAVFERGRKIADGSPDGVQRDPAVIHAYLGTARTLREAAE
ncbi:MAG: ABC transporter ATP-binding protein [Proteobacteria bacterium]|nr:ABC transporter ATP-binding protein [Pseudomonadota bacterium]